MKTKYSYLLTHIFPIIVYCTVIHIQSSYPPSGHIPTVPGVDKLLHFAAYGVLGALIFRALILIPSFRQKPESNRTASLMMLSVLLATIYGMVDEFHQYNTPLRTPDMFDVLADMAGGTAGVLIYLLVWMRFAMIKKIVR